MPTQGKAELDRRHEEHLAKQQAWADKTKRKAQRKAKRKASAAVTGSDAQRAASQRSSGMPAAAGQHAAAATDVCWLAMLKGTDGTRCAQADGCYAELGPRGAKNYCRRNHLCKVHISASSILQGGRRMRSCHVCNRLHTLDAFDGEKRQAALPHASATVCGMVARWRARKQSFRANAHERVYLLRGSAIAGPQPDHPAFACRCCQAQVQRQHQTLLRRQWEDESHSAAAGHAGQHGEPAAGMAPEDPAAEAAVLDNAPQAGDLAVPSASAQPAAEKSMPKHTESHCQVKSKPIGLLQALPNRDRRPTVVIEFSLQSFARSVS